MAPGGTVRTTGPNGSVSYSAPGRSTSYTQQTMGTVTYRGGSAQQISRPTTIVTGGQTVIVNRTYVQRGSTVIYAPSRPVVIGSYTPYSLFAPTPVMYGSCWGCSRFYYGGYAMAPSYASPGAMFAAALTGAVVGSIVTDMYLRDRYLERQRSQELYLQQQMELERLRAQQQSSWFGSSSRSSEIAALEQQVSEMKQRMAQQDAEIAAQKEAIAQGKVDLSALQEKVRLQEEDIKLLEQQREEGLKALASGKVWDLDDLIDNHKLDRHPFTVGEDPGPDGQPIQVINDLTSAVCTLTDGDMFRFAAGERPSLQKPHLQIIYSKDEDCPVGSTGTLAVRDEDASRQVLQNLINKFFEDLEVDSQKLVQQN